MAYQRKLIKQIRDISSLPEPDENSDLSNAYCNVDRYGWSFWLRVGTGLKTKDRFTLQFSPMHEARVSYAGEDAVFVFSHPKAIIELLKFHLKNEESWKSE